MKDQENFHVELVSGLPEEKKKRLHRTFQKKLQKSEYTYTEVFYCAATPAQIWATKSFAYEVSKQTSKKPGLFGSRVQRAEVCLDEKRLQEFMTNSVTLLLSSMRVVDISVVEGRIDTIK